MAFKGRIKLTWGILVDGLSNVLGVALSKLSTQALSNVREGRQTVDLLVTCLCLLLKILSNGQIILWLDCSSIACA